MTRAELIQAVALRMDEVSPDIEVADLTVDGSDNNPLYTLIDGLVDGGVLELFSVAPYWRLHQKAFSSSDIKLDNVGTARTINDNQSTIAVRKMVRIKLSDDFLRVAEIDCADFQRPITEVYPEQSEQGKRQHNPFLMAKEARPVGVMSHGKWTTSSQGVDTTVLCREIDCYSLSSSTTVSASAFNATYIAVPDAIDDDDTDAVEDVVPPVLIPAVEWLIASRTFGARGDSNHAAICQQNAQNLLV